MREIKFRAWDGESLHYGGFAVHATGSLVRDFQFIPEDVPIMQYTGLKDKNGVEIYEGDVVAVYSNLDDCKCAISVGWNYKYGMWYSYGDNEYRCYPLSDVLCDMSIAGCEVIGNIYENPELLND